MCCACSALCLDNPGGINVLPYVTEVSKNIVPLSNFDLFATQVIRDLDAAEALLKEVDPITRFTLAQLNPDPNYTAGNRCPR